MPRHINIILHWLKSCCEEINSNLKHAVSWFKCSLLYVPYIMYIVRVCLLSWIICLVLLYIALGFVVISPHLLCFCSRRTSFNLQWSDSCPGVLQRHDFKIYNFESANNNTCGTHLGLLNFLLICYFSHFVA